MFIKLFRRLFLVREIVSKAGVVHFRRYRVLWTPWVSIYVHHILEADQDKHLHNHPWNFWGVILRGGYLELLEDNQPVSRKAGSCGYRSVNEFHKIKELYAPTWSLCVMGGRAGVWGYSTEDGFVDHESYRRLKNQGHW